MDFYCSKLKLAIEIDGDSHGYLKNQLRDQEKEQYFKSLGIHILRYEDFDVKTDIAAVLDHLIDWTEVNNPPIPLF